MRDRNEWFKDVKRLIAYIEDIKYCPFCGEEL